MSIGIFYFSSLDNGSKLYDTIMDNRSDKLYIYDSSLDVNNVIFSRSTGVLAGMSCEFFNINFGSAKYFTTANSKVTASAINCTFLGSLATQVNAGPGTTGACTNYLKYDVEFAIKDSAGNAITDFHVRIVDSAGTEITNDTYSAAIRCTTYMVVGGSPDVHTNYNPLEIWVSKKGYQTYYEKITITNDNRKRAITLLHSASPGRGSMGENQR
jgi:hypothetical protein